MKTYTKQKKVLVGVYMSSEEHDFLMRTADAYGMKKSEVLKRLAFRENDKANFQRNDNWSVRRR